MRSHALFIIPYVGTDVLPEDEATWSLLQGHSTLSELLVLRLSELQPLGMLQKSQYAAPSFEPILSR